MSSRFGKTAQVEILDELLLTSGITGESKLNLDQLDHVYETGAYYFLKFKTAEVFILPKAQIPLEDFNVVLNELIRKYNLGFSQELNWRFR